MFVKQLLVSAAIAAATSGAMAQSASATFSCDPGHFVVGTVTLQIRPQDGGRPGFVALAAEIPGGGSGAYLSQAGTWISNTIPGDHEFARYASLPSSVVFSFCVPEVIDGTATGCAVTTAGSVGTALYATWGAQTPEIEADANARERAMQATNARLISLGKPQREFDRQRWIESAVAREGRNNAVFAGTVPFVDCTPPDTGH